MCRLLPSLPVDFKAFESISSGQSLYSEISPAASSGYYIRTASLDNAHNLTRHEYPVVWRKAVMQTYRFAITLLFIEVLVTGCSCTGAITQTPDSLPPAYGLWIASLHFGSISFEVNNSGTGLTQVAFDLSWQCGSQFLNGPFTFVSDGQDWLIQDGFFAVMLDVPGGHPLKSVLIEGQFDSTGTSAWGIWRGVSPYDETCELTWNAKPSEEIIKYYQFVSCPSHHCIRILIPNLQ